jgi:hypothetical protein
MTELTPAADAVLNAYMANCGWLDGLLEKEYRCAAAILRAAADQVQMDRPLGDNDADAGVFAAHHAIRAQFLAIAEELDSV